MNHMTSPYYWADSSENRINENFFLKLKSNLDEYSLN